MMIDDGSADAGTNVRQPPESGRIERMSRFQFSLRQLLGATAIAAVACLVVPPIYQIIDSLVCGPQVVWFNKRCERIVKSRGLIGKTPEEVREALGEPAFVYRYDEPGSFTFNYAAHPSFPNYNFQAHFTDGTLASTELFDL
jgi:hypothetical protein